MKDIINNRISADNRERLTQCRLIALAKPLKPDETTAGVRPIAIGEALLKVASTIMVLSLTDTTNKHFQGIQYGVGYKGGAEYICHFIKKNLSLGALITVAIDAKNAFNSPFRLAIVRELRKASNEKFKPLWNLWNLAYSTPSSLHFQNDEQSEVIKSQRGTRQGDVLGGLFFSLVIHPILVACTLNPAFAGITILAYLDDITLQGNDPIAMRECIEFIEAEFLKIGLEFNGSKCEWMSATHPCPFDNWLAPKDYVKILGAFHGTDESLITRVLREYCQKRHEPFFRRLQELPHSIALIILGACGIPRMNYTVRVQHPDVTQPACADFDAEVVKIWAAIAEVDPDNMLTRAIASLPTTLGGCGFTNFESIREGAYLASIAESLKREGAPDQRVASSLVHQERFDEITKDGEVKLHLTDCTQKGNSTWLRSGKDVESHMTDQVTGAALRLRLNAPHKYCLDHTCPGCQHKTTRANHNQHVVGCARIKNRNSSHAHAAFKIGLAKVLHKRRIQQDAAEPAGYAIKWCPSCKQNIQTKNIDAHLANSPSCDGTKLHASREARPDVRIYLRTHNVVVDLTMVSVIGTADATSVDKILAQRDRKKDKNYKNAVESEGERFACLAATRNGTLSATTIALGNLVVAESVINKDSTKKYAQEISRAAIEASAKSLINAEREMGIAHAPSRNKHREREVIEDAQRDHRMLARVTQPPPHRPMPSPTRLRSPTPEAEEEDVPPLEAVPTATRPTPSPAKAPPAEARKPRNEAASRSPSPDPVTEVDTKSNAALICRNQSHYQTEDSSTARDVSATDDGDRERRSMSVDSAIRQDGQGERKVMHASEMRTPLSTIVMFAFVLAILSLHLLDRRAWAFYTTGVALGYVAYALRSKFIALLSIAVFLALVTVLIIGQDAAEQLWEKTVEHWFTALIIAIGGRALLSNDHLWLIAASGATGAVLVAGFWYGAFRTLAHDLSHSPEVVRRAATHLTPERVASIVRARLREIQIAMFVLSLLAFLSLYSWASSYRRIREYGAPFRPTNSTSLNTRLYDRMCHLHKFHVILDQPSSRTTDTSEGFFALFAESPLASVLAFAAVVALFFSAHGVIRLFYRIAHHTAAALWKRIVKFLLSFALVRVLRRTDDHVVPQRTGWTRSVRAPVAGVATTGKSRSRAPVAVD